MTSSNPSGGANLPHKDPFKGYREHRRMISSSSEDSTSSFKSTLSTHPKFVKMQKRTTATPNAPAASVNTRMQSPVKTSPSTPLKVSSSSNSVTTSKVMPPSRAVTSVPDAKEMPPGTPIRASTRNIGITSVSTPLAMKDPNRSLQTSSVHAVPKSSAKAQVTPLPSTGPNQKASASGISSPLVRRDVTRSRQTQAGHTSSKPSLAPQQYATASTSSYKNAMPVTPARTTGGRVATPSVLTPLASKDQDRILQTPSTTAKLAPDMNLKTAPLRPSEGLKQSIHAPESARQSRQIERIPTDIALPKQAPIAPIIKPQVKAFDANAFESQNWMSNLSASKIEADDDDDDRRLRKGMPINLTPCMDIGQNPVSREPFRPVLEKPIDLAKRDDETRSSYAKTQRNAGIRPILKPKSIRVRRDLQEYEKVEMSESYEQEFGVRALEEDDEDEGFEHLSRPPSPVGPRKTYIRGKTESELGLNSTPSTPAVSLHPSDTGSDDSDSHIVPYEDSDDENEEFQAGDDTWQHVPSPERSPKGRLTPYHQRYVSDLDHIRGPIRTTSMGNLVEGMTGDWLQLDKEVDGTLAANKNGASGRSDPHRRKSTWRVLKNVVTGSNRPRKGAAEDASEMSSYVSSTVKTAPVTKPEKQKVLRAQEARRTMRADKEQRLAAVRSTVFPVRNTIPSRVTPEEKHLYQAMNIETMRRGMLDAARSETCLPPHEGAKADLRDRDLKRRALAGIRKQDGESNEEYLKRNVQNRADLFGVGKNRKDRGGLNQSELV